MTETARVLLTAGVLSAVALAIFVWRLARPGRAGHEYLVDQLRLSQWASLLLAGVGGAGIGLAVANAASPGALVEATVGVVTLAASVVVLQREPPEALLLLGILFLLHAVFDWAHRPALLTAQFVPQWWTMGTALFDIHICALCLFARRAGRVR